MTDNKLTDEQIIKGVECCKEKNCTTCPCYDDDIECGEMLIGYTIDLINRKNAEIERLTKENEIMKTNCNSMCMSMPNIAKAERTKARKEFWDRLKKEAITKYDWNDYIEMECGDNLLKEMEGEL